MGIETALLLSGGVKAVSSLARGNAANKQAKANAQIDLQDAEVKIQEARERAAIRRRAGQRAAKSERVAAAASGFTQEGTSLQLQLEQLKQAELNAQEELRVGRIEERRLQQSAIANIRRGKVAKRASFFEAASAGVNAVSGIQQNRIANG